MSHPWEHSQVILHSHLMQNCFQVRFQNNIGTAFLWGNEGGTIFVTAAHVIRGCQPGDNVLIKTSDDWATVQIAFVKFDEDGYDLAVFATSNFATMCDMEFHLNTGVLPGAMVKFLGFPHQLEGNYPGIGYPTPLVRSANFSGVVLLENRITVILDGFNNPGYSGGPVYAVRPDGEVGLLGLISGFRHEKPALGKIYRRTDDGGEEEVEEHYVRSNSGMIYAVGSKRLADILRSVTNFNPTASAPK